MDEEELTSVPEKARHESRTTDCDSCGGEMFYSPEEKKLICRFCGSTKEINFTADDVQELNIHQMAAYEENHDWSMETKVFECTNCGGQTVASSEDETSYCAFCGSQHIVVHKDGDAGLPPQGILPYELSFDRARQQMDQWVKRRWLAPNDLKERFRGKNLTGIYMPYWTFDSDTRADYHVQIGEYYYTGSGEDRKRHTRWYHYKGNHRIHFDDVLILGIDSDEARLMKRIEPFHTEGSRVMDYKPEFLAGYLAKKHTIKPSPAWEQAKDDMADEMEGQIKRSLPGDTTRHYHQTVTFRSNTFKHILLPVYMTAYEYNNKIYNVLINGQTGEVQGKAPVSPWKAAGLAVLGVIIAGAVLYISNG